MLSKGYVSFLSCRNNMDSPEKEPNSPNGDSSPSYPLLPTPITQGQDPKDNTIWIPPQDGKIFFIISMRSHNTEFNIYSII